MKYEYVGSAKFSDPKIRIVSDKDGKLFIRKNTHIDSRLAERLAEISCPYVVKFSEYGEDDDGEYVIEEYIEGVTAAESTFTRKQAVRVLPELCDFIFYDDPAVYGNWEVVGGMRKDDYDKWFSGVLIVDNSDQCWLKKIDFLSNGAAKTQLRSDDYYFSYFWTNGYFISNGNRIQTISEYFIVTLNGSDYLLLENKNGDYVDRLKNDTYILLKRTGA